MYHFDILMCRCLSRILYINTQQRNTQRRKPKYQTHNYPPVRNNSAFCHAKTWHTIASCRRGALQKQRIGQDSSFKPPSNCTVVYIHVYCIQRCAYFCGCVKSPDLHIHKSCVLRFEFILPIMAFSADLWYSKIRKYPIFATYTPYFDILSNFCGIVGGNCTLLEVHFF